ncbi:MAG: MFS transporter [Lachnospiraceae bacterium]|nr:MFS transporter [Lachnospiraceae bacterium]
MKMNYNKTITACFIGYIVQAIVNNFVPLLFLTFQSQYQIPLSKITMLVTFNFGLQLVVDLVSVSFVDKIGYRASMIIAHVCAALGLLLLPVLPELFGSMGMDPFTGILMAVLLYAIGGGLLEVLVSPVVEACPSDNKEKTMSLLHSFYCWGHVGVVVISTIFFAIFGIENWKYAAVFWALIPAANAILFTKVPIRHLIEDGEQGLNLKELIGMKTFWIFVLMMVCAGASEQAVSQWASTFAEKGLGVAKTIGDLAGPMSFAICMGAARAFYGKYGEKIRLRRFMLYSTCLCIASYLLIVFVSNPVIGLLGCALCGMSVGIMWPGTFSMASATIKGGGTAMFAFLALAGDLGCSGGPSLVGFVSGCFEDDLRKGIMAATVFPILLIVGIVWNRQDVRKKS